MVAVGLGQTCIPDGAFVHPRKLSLALDGFLVHPQSEEKIMGGWSEGVTVMLHVVTVWHFSTSSSSNFLRS